MANAKKGITGWTYREHRPHFRRHELAPERFYSETVPSEPGSAACDEPEYVDPDAFHENLPVGSRFWQGFAKPGHQPGAEERPLSPGWVAKITASVPSLDIPWPEHEEADPHWERRVRQTQRERFLQNPREIWPG